MSGRRNGARTPRILVAEDERLISCLLCSMLRSNGYDVVAAFETREAVAYAAASPPPDAILLDIHMPGGSACDVIRALKASSVTARIPVIIVSGSANSAERREVEGYGVAASLYKPVDMSLLLAAVAAALTGAEARQPEGAER